MWAIAELVFLSPIKTGFLSDFTGWMSQWRAKETVQGWDWRSPKASSKAWKDVLRSDLNREKVVFYSHLTCLESAATRYRILLVEDDPKLAKFIESELGFEGYHVTVAPNGLDGLTIARDAQPDLLILDWMLPGISGLDICLRLRSTGVQVPIIMLTAKDEVSARVT